MNSQLLSARGQNLTERAFENIPHQHLLPRDIGWVEVITGSMFSGKTEELLRRIRRAQIARQSVLLIKPELDTRYAVDHVVSHNQFRLPCVAVREPSKILELAHEAWVVGIDEAQFFSSDLVDVVQTLADQGKRVIIAGLDQDYRGLPFHPIPELMAIAEYVTKHLAICARCGNPATRNQRLGSSSDQVVLGSLESYEARCRKCFEPPKENE